MGRGDDKASWMTPQTGPFPPVTTDRATCNIANPIVGKLFDNVCMVLEDCLHVVMLDQLKESLTIFDDLGLIDRLCCAADELMDTGKKWNMSQENQRLVLTRLTQEILQSG